MKNATRYILFLLTATILLWSCQKELSIDSGVATPGNPSSGNNGGTTSSNYGWSFTGASNADYHGCVDTAYYEVTSGIKMLSIEGTDSAGNEFILSLVSPSGNFSPATYTPANGAMMAVSAGFDAYAATSPSSFTLNITNVNDTLVEGNFTANLESVSGGATLAITNGKLKALIGKPNPCSSSPDNGGGTPDPNADAVFDLASAGGNCSNADVQGSYMVNTDLDASNQVTMDVDVTSAGNWSVSTNTVNGITFSGSGTFNFPGLQSITLQASGKPLASGTTTFPITAGNSSCSFSLTVDTIPVAPCTPPNNSVTFSTAGVTNFTFTHVYTTVSDTYNLTGNGSGGDIELTFAGNTPPAAGVYDIRGIAGSLGPKEVAVYLDASNILWQASSGKLYVSKVNGKIVATFCDVAFSGTLGGPSFNTNVTAKMTQD